MPRPRHVALVCDRCGETGHIKPDCDAAHGRAKPKMGGGGNRGKVHMRRDRDRFNGRMRGDKKREPMFDRNQIKGWCD